MKVNHLIRLATVPVEGDDRLDSSNVREFAGDTLEGTVAQAMAWNADRTNHGPVGETDFIIQRWDVKDQAWKQLDWWQFVSGA